MNFIINRNLKKGGRMVTTKRLLRSSLAKNVEKSIKEKGLSLKNLLNDLKQERKRYMAEHP